jgi:hypothetical protein
VCDSTEIFKFFILLGVLSIRQNKGRINSYRLQIHIQKSSFLCFNQIFMIKINSFLEKNN